MSGEFDAYQKMRATEPERFHEGGHGAAARQLAPGAHVNSRLTGLGSGVAEIDFPPGTPIEVQYRVAVAGFLAEARQLSGRTIDIERQNMIILADQIIAELRKGLSTFKLEVPVAGSVVQQAACNPDDFGWLHGHLPEREILIDALIDVSGLIETPSWKRDIEVIAELLLRNDRYDSAIDRFWEE